MDHILGVKRLTRGDTLHPQEALGLKQLSRFTTVQKAFQRLEAAVKKKPSNNGKRAAQWRLLSRSRFSLIDSQFIRYRSRSWHNYDNDNKDFYNTIANLASTNRGKRNVGCTGKVSSVNSCSSSYLGLFPQRVFLYLDLDRDHFIPLGINEHSSFFIHHSYPIDTLI